MDKLASLKEREEELTAQYAKLVSASAPLRKQLGNADREIAQVRTDLATVQQDIRKMKEAPRVSDHAVIRFLERKHGFDFENVRKQLLSPAVIKAMEIGAQGVKIDGGRLVIKEKTVVTFT